MFPRAPVTGCAALCLCLMKHFHHTLLVNTVTVQCEFWSRFLCAQFSCSLRWLFG